METISNPDEAKAKALSFPLFFIVESVVELGGYVDCRFRDDNKPMRKACSKQERIAKHRRRHWQFFDEKLETTISTFSLSA
ncbi:MAG: hypothetical protein ACXV7J_14635 [Methylomonas sp.]